MVDPVVDVIVRTALAWLLAAAAWHKLRDGAAFRATLAAYALVPPAAVATAAWGVVAGELLLAAALLVPAWRVPALGGTAALLLGYGGAMAINLARGRRDLDCGCGGTPRPIGGGLLVRNLVLAAVACLAAAAPPAARPLGWVDALSAIGATLALAACWLAADGLLALQPAAARLRGAR